MWNLFITESVKLINKKYKKGDLAYKIKLRGIYVTNGQFRLWHERTD